MKSCYIIIAIIISPALFWLVYSLLGLLDSSIPPENKLTFVGILFGLLVTLFTQYEIGAREIEARHFEKKAEAYSLFHDVVFKRFVENDTSNEVKDLAEVRKRILIWGSADLIKSLNNSVDVARTNNEEASRAAGEKVLKSMRKDLGHDDNYLLKDLELIKLIQPDLGKK